MTAVSVAVGIRFLGPQNIGLSDFFRQTAQQSGLEGTISFRERGGSPLKIGPSSERDPLMLLVRTYVQLC